MAQRREFLQCSCFPDNPRHVRVTNACTGDADPFGFKGNIAGRGLPVYDAPATLSQVAIPLTQQLVTDAIVSEGLGNSLLVKLYAAHEKLLQSDADTAINQLTAYRYEWDAQDLTSAIGPNADNPSFVIGDLLAPLKGDTEPDF